MRVAGIGFRADAPLASLAEALARAEAQSGPAGMLATATEKAGAGVIRSLAQNRGLSLAGVAVAGVATPTQSPRVAAAFGTGSVAEAAALAAAGPGARLVARRITSTDGMATAAMAESLDETAT